MLLQGKGAKGTEELNERNTRLATIGRIGYADSDTRPHSYGGGSERRDERSVVDANAQNRDTDGDDGRVSDVGGYAKDTKCVIRVDAVSSRG